MAVGPTMPGLRAALGDPQWSRDRLIGFRAGLYQCLTRRADSLFDLVDAVLTGVGPVRSLVELSLEKTFRRGWGALYGALARGRIDVAGLARLIASCVQPVDTGPVKIAVDVSVWPRPDAVTSPDLCHCYAACRCDGSRKTIPGWPFSFAAALEWGASSWTGPLDVVRLGPHDDATRATVEQVAAVFARLDAVGCLGGRPAPLFVFDSGYDLTRITYLSAEAGLGVQVLGRVRADRVFYSAAPAHHPDGQVGRPRKHGARFELGMPDLLPAPDEQLGASNPRYGAVRVSAWHGLHQKLNRQAGWATFTGVLPIVAGTVIRVQVQHLPGDRRPADLWLWHTAPAGTGFDLDLLWKTYLRRFDLEHTFRLIKQVLGWCAPHVRTPDQAERWSWLILAAYTQLRLARTLTANLRRPWEKPLPAGVLPTPGRVRRGFANLRRTLGTPARGPKPTVPGPGRPKGTTRPPRTRYTVGKTSPTNDKTEQPENDVTT